MFENFVLGTQAQTANVSTLDDDISASPTDCSFLPTASPQPTYPSNYVSSRKPGGINDIVDQLSQQSLRPEDHELPQQSIWRDSNLLSPDFEDDPMNQFTMEELTYTSTTRGRVTLPNHHTHSLPTPSSTPARGTAVCRRLQRQLNVQMQSCGNHMRDISALVEGMVASESQCRLHRPTPSRPRIESPVDDQFAVHIPDFEGRPISPDEDEGFAEMEEDHLALDEEMTLRRASTPSGIRKYNVVRWRNSADCVSAVNAQGRTKVRCVPRMRRRPKVPETQP